MPGALPLDTTDEPTSPNRSVPYRIQISVVTAGISSPRPRGSASLLPRPTGPRRGHRYRRTGPWPAVWCPRTCAIHPAHGVYTRQRDAPTRELARDHPRRRGMVGDRARTFGEGVIGWGLVAGGSTPVTAP